MNIRIKIAALAFAIAGLTGLGLATAGSALAETTTTNSLSYEFDNGAQWTLQKNAAALSSTIPDKGYADAGIVVDLGPASTFTSLTVTGSGDLAENIWLGDGSEAYTPATHNLSDGANFSYGPYGQTFWTGPQAGQPATDSYIQGLGNTEVYAWVGVVHTGNGAVSGSVTSVNGHSVGNRTMSLTPDGFGNVVAVIK